MKRAFYLIAALPLLLGAAVRDVSLVVQEGTAGGSISTQGLYTAPASSGIFHVAATSLFTPTISATSQVTVAQAQTVAVTVSPTAAPVAECISQQITATVTGTANTAVTWKVVETGGGLVTPNGLYTAPGPDAPGTYHVTATSVADSTKVATATMTVTGKVNAVGLTPLSAVLPISGTQQFVTTVSTTCGTFPANVVNPTPPPSGIIPVDRLTTWNPGIPGGIPTRTAICSTLSPNGTDDLAAIQAALNACPANGVVKLNAGAFKVTDTVRIPANVVLRGSGTIAGAGSAGTSITGTGARFVWQQQWTTLVAMDPGFGGWTQITGLATDATKGASTVTLKAALSLTPGEIVLIDQLSDSTVTTWGDEDGGPGAANRGWFCRGPNSQGEAVGRPTGQMMEVSSVSGTTVTFTTPFHMTYSVANTAQLARMGSNNSGTGSVVAALKNAGIEDVTLVGGTGGDGGANLAMRATAYSWARNVESDKSAGTAIALGSVQAAGAFRCNLEGSYLHDTINPTPGGDGYGIGLAEHAADNLVTNNISVRFNKVMLMRATGGGNVIGYNYVDDGWISFSLGWMEVGLNASHMAGAHYELFEGNMGFNMDADSTWGNATYITGLRNQFLGFMKTKAYGSNRRAAGLMTGHWWYTFVGNVLGAANMPLNGASGFIYQEIAGPWSDNPVPMWKLGYNPVSWNNQPDQKVLSTVIRDGNYDFATKTTTWVSGPKAIPNSLYLTSKPAFFGTLPWPWVDPLTGNTTALPAKVRADGMAAIAVGAVRSAVAPAKARAKLTKREMLLAPKVERLPVRAALP